MCSTVAKGDNKTEMLFYKYNIKVGIRDWLTKQKLIMEYYALLEKIAPYVMWCVCMGACVCYVCVLGTVLTCFWHKMQSHLLKFVKCVIRLEVKIQAGCYACVKNKLYSDALVRALYTINMS